MYLVRVKLKNWKNFNAADIALSDRGFLIGPTPAGNPISWIFFAS